jgi:hypothetical protein
MAKDYIGVYKRLIHSNVGRDQNRVANITACSDKRIDDSNRTSVAQADATLIV